MTDFIPYNRQWIDEDDINSVVEVLRSDSITQGPEIEIFEKNLAGYCGSKYAVTFSSGTAALHGAYFSAGINSGDEVITSPLTFSATSNAALYLNAVPVFTDIESDTGNIDISLIEKSVTKKTKVLVPVHYSGHPVDLEPVYDLANRNNLVVIEDACHALGAKYKGQRTGNCRFSDMTVFSFHPLKHITTGEGGAVLTNNEELYKKLVLFKEHGITKNDFINKSQGDWYYEMQFLGYNYRMTDFQAALGNSQLGKLDFFISTIQKIAHYYKEAFNNNPYFDIPVEKEYAFSSYHIYPIRLRDKYMGIKDTIFRKLRHRGIGVQSHYIPVYTHPYYHGLGYRTGLCPLAEDFYKREISIPIHPSMIDEDMKYVVKQLLDTFSEL